MSSDYARQQHRENERNEKFNELHKSYEYRLAEKFLSFTDRPFPYAEWSDFSWLPQGEKRDPGWLCQKKKGDLTPHRLVQMYQGKKDVVGTYCLDASDRVRSFILDIDDHSGKGDAQTQLYQVQKVLMHWAPRSYYLARSKGGKGFHVRVFFENPIHGFVARKLAKYIIHASTIPSNTEIFPKQNQLRGNIGSQVGLPGSKIWMDAKGGSMLIDPVTRDPVPFDQWIELLDRIEGISEEKIRELGNHVGRDFFEEVHFQVETTVEKVTAPGVPDFENADQLLHWIESHGLSVQQIKGISGSYTDRFILSECPNQQAHGSTRSDGAAVLYNANTRCVQYRCCHNSCDMRFRWKQLLEQLGFVIDRDDPYDEHLPPDLCDPRSPEEIAGRWGHRRDASPIVETQPLGDIDPSEPEEGPSDRKYDFEPEGFARCTEEERQRWIAFGNANKDAPKKSAWHRLACRLEKAGRCGCLSKKKICKDHGVFGRFNRPCDDVLFETDCARISTKIIKKGIETEWPDEVYEVEIPIPHEDWGAGRQAWTDAKTKIDRSGKGALPCFVTGTDSLLLYWPVEYQRLVAYLYPDARRIDRREAASHVAQAWFSAHAAFLSFFRSHETLIDILEFPWFKNGGTHRHGGGPKICAILPIGSIAQNRAKKNEKWKKEHPGLDHSHCPFIVYKDGVATYCGKLGHCCLYHRPTMTLIAEKDGDFTEKEEYEILNAHPCEKAWILSNKNLTLISGP